jgi:hypothetical protein
VVLNKVDFAYKNKNFSLKGKEIFYIFRVDENNTVVDKLNGNIKRQNPKQINGSSIYPKETIYLKNRIDLLIKINAEIT